MWVQGEAGRAGRLKQPPAVPRIATNQHQLLQLVAAGDSLAEAAAAFGCSERHARRHLHEVWNTLGARNRSDGITRAARYGLLDQPPGRPEPGTDLRPLP